MTFEVDCERAMHVAGDAGRHAVALQGFGRTLRTIGTHFGLSAEVSLPAHLCHETSGELATLGDVIQHRVELATLADERSIGYEAAEARYTAAFMRLLESLDDAVGATGIGDDRLRLLAQTVLGSGGRPVDAELHRAVLAAADPDEIAAYWEALPTDEQDRALEHSTVSVSDAYLRGDIALDDAQLIVLQMRPIPIDGRRPASGEGTDWAGIEVPAAPPEWAYDAEPRAVLGGSSICAAIQGFSSIPSPAPARPIDVAAGSPGIAWQLRETMGSPARALRVGARSLSIPSAVASTLDVLLCRLGVGSGYPISTEQVVDDDGELVYEGSRTDHKYDIDGVPLHPDPRRRDVQMWNKEHSNDLGYVIEPYPGFPAYEVNARGYAP